MAGDGSPRGVRGLGREGRREHDESDELPMRWGGWGWGERGTEKENVFHFEWAGVIGDERGRRKSVRIVAQTVRCSIGSRVQLQQQGSLSAMTQH